MVYEGSVDIQYALEGLNLTTAITNYDKPFEDSFFNLKDGEIPTDNMGLFAIIMDELARRAKFSWRNSYAAIRAIDLSAENVNKTWTDLLEWQVNTFDISVE
jgi:hypothetical protein